MRLREALQRALQFADGSSAYVTLTPAVFDPNTEAQFVPFRSEHVLVPVPLIPAYVTATDGTTVVRCTVDPDVWVPAASLEATALKQALSSVSRKHEVTVIPIGAALAAMYVNDGVTATTRHIQMLDKPQRHPWHVGGVMHHVLPERITTLLKIVHAASDNPDEPDLAWLHLTPHFSEATDRARLSRANGGIVSTPILAPAGTFWKWPKMTGLPVGVNVDGDHLTLQIDDEARQVKVRPAVGYMDLSPHLDRGGYAADVVACDLEDAIAAARKASAIDVVELEFQRSTLSVRGLAADGLVQYHRDVATRTNGAEVVRCAFKGKLLVEAVSAMGASIARAHYRHASAGVVFGCPTITEVVWPMIDPSTPVS